MTELEPTRPGELAAADLTVSQATADRISDGMSANTRRAYDRQMRRFTAWCAEANRTALPCSPQTLAEYVSSLCDADLAPSSIEQAIAVIRSAHTLAGYDHQPDTAAARLVLRSHRRDRAEQGKRTRKAPPITLEILRRMIEATPAAAERDGKQEPILAGLRDRALLVLGFALMGRRSELAALRIGDVTETDDGLEISIRMSKTDQDAIGETVAIPRGTHADTDPVRVVRAWLAALAEHGITDGRLLRAVNRWGHPGIAISEDGINKAVREAAIRAEVPNAEQVTAHSLRAGGATAAYKSGAAVSVIAAHGRWAPNSPVVLGYIRAVDRWTDNPMRGIGL